MTFIYLFLLVLQSVCRLQHWGRCLAGAMAAQTVQFWQILKPLGTPVSPAPGNTCGSPSLVVRGKQDVKCYFGWLVIRIFFFIKSDKFSLQFHDTSWKMWVEGQQIRSWSLTTHMVRTKGRESSRLSCLWQMSELRLLLPAGGWYTGPTYRRQNVLLTNCLEIIDKILGMCNEVCGTQAAVACTFFSKMQGPHDVSSFRSLFFSLLQ